MIVNLKVCRSVGHKLLQTTVGCLTQMFLKDIMKTKSYLSWNGWGIGCMDALFFKITLVFYLGGTILFLAYVVSRKEALSTFSITATAIGFCAHLLALVTRMIQLGYLPLTNLTEA